MSGYPRPTCEYTIIINKKKILKKKARFILGLAFLARTDDPVSSSPSNKLILTPHVCWTENYL